jgi:hypothetical protein
LGSTAVQFDDLSVNFSEELKILSSSVHQINSTWTSGMESRKENSCPAEIQKLSSRMTETPNNVINNRFVISGSQKFSRSPYIKVIYASAILQVDYIQC